MCVEGGQGYPIRYWDPYLSGPFPERPVGLANGPEFNENDPMTASDATHAQSMLALRISSGSQARIATHGAQVMSWIHGGRERLFTSPQAVFRPGLAIRGGIPVIFPQFGDRGPGLRHGFARLLAWMPVPAATAPDRATFLLRESRDSLRWWPHRFRAELEVRLLDDRLSTSLTVTNCDAAAFSFTAALHTYLRVSHIEHAGVFGLQEQSYLDAANDRRLGLQHEAALRFAGEVDRVYPDSGGRGLSLHDASGALHIHSEGFTDTVVWNPGADLAASLGDLGPGNHAHFVCVEAACVETPVQLAPGTTWQGRQILACLDG